MIRDLIIDLSPILIVALLVLFTVIKLYMIVSELKKDYLSVFFSSLGFINKVQIRNTFHEKLKAYYKRSNQINTIFYPAITLVLVVYMLMKSI